MQIPGRTCCLCSEPIATAASARGCAACDLSWHIACLAESDICPQCGRNVVAEEREEDAIQSRRAAKKIAGGRLIYRLMFLAYLVVVISFNYLAITVAGGVWWMFTLQSAARLTVFAVFWTYAYTGSSRARKLLGFFWFVSLFFTPWTLAVSTWFSAVLLITGLFTVWACWFSPQVKCYESARRNR